MPAVHTSQTLRLPAIGRQVTHSAGTWRDLTRASLRRDSGGLAHSSRSRPRVLWLGDGDGDQAGLCSGAVERRPGVEPLAEGARDATSRS